MEEVAVGIATACAGFALNSVAKGATKIVKQVRSKHCAHCTGFDEECTCKKGCKVKPNTTECSAIWKHCRHCRGLESDICSCRFGCATSNGNKVACQHNLICSGCGLHGIDGPVYQCRHCRAFSYCQPCYTTDSGHTTHAFREIKWPGATPQAIAAKGPNDSQRVGRPSPSPPSATSTTHPPVVPLAAHAGVTCDNCMAKSFQGPRFKCCDCADYDLCGTCYGNNSIHPGHAFCLFQTSSSRREAMPPRPSVVAATSPPAARYCNPTTSSYPTNAIHKNVACNGCVVYPICGVRYNCSICSSFDLCHNCYSSSKHIHPPDHAFFQIDRPGAIPVVRY